MVTIGAEDNYKFRGFYGKILSDNIDIPGMGHIKLINGNLINNFPNEIVLTKEAADKLSEAENMGKEVNMTFKIREL